MKGSDLTEKQLAAAKQYILLRSPQTTGEPEPERFLQLSWQNLVMLVAEYGAIQAASVENGGSVDEPGEVHLTVKEKA